MIRVAFFYLINLFKIHIQRPVCNQFNIVKTHSRIALPLNRTKSAGYILNGLTKCLPHRTTPSCIKGTHHLIAGIGWSVWAWTPYPALLLGLVLAFSAASSARNLVLGVGLGRVPALMLAAGLLITGAVCTLCCGLRRRAKERRMDPDAAEVRAQRDFASLPASLCC